MARNRTRDWHVNRSYNHVPFVPVKKPKKSKPVTETAISLKEYASVEFLQADAFKSIEEELMAVLSAEITKSIDEEIIKTLSLGELYELSKKLHEARDSIYVEGLGKVPPNVYNGPLTIQNHVAFRRFRHALSWKRDLGGNLEQWMERLRRFRPVSSWSHQIDVEKNDAFFYFELEDDRINFLLLMR